jgi:hypothetical protein
VCRNISADRAPRTQLVETDTSRAVVELLVKVHRGVDQGQVGERLGEVAQLPASWSDLLGEQANVIGM